MSSVWQQQIFALDVRYNSHRAKCLPNFRTLYIRRRNQLLKEHCGNKDPDLWRQYLYIRGVLLQNRYGIAVDQTSLKKQSFSSRVSPESMICSSENSVPQIIKDDDNVVLTKMADASRAIVGNNSVAENYSFVGVHHIFDQHVGAVPMVKFANNDRSRLCCVSHDNTLSICNVLSNPPSVLCVLKQHTRPVTGCDWSAANDLIVSCSVDGLLCLWDTQSFTCLRAVSEAIPVPLLSCLFHPVNNNYVLAGNSKGEVEVLNVSTGIKQRSTMGGKVVSLAFESNGNLLWSGNDQGIILSFSFDMTSGKLRKLRRVYLGEMAAVTSINYRAWISREAPDPSLLVNLSANSVRLYRVADKQGSLELKRRYSIKHKSHHNPIHSTFCPIMSFRLGACIVTGSEDSSIYFIDVREEVENKAVVNRLQAHASPVLGVSFNYDESLLATSDYQGLIILWNRAQQSLSDLL